MVGLSGHASSGEDPGGLAKPPALAAQQVNAEVRPLRACSFFQALLISSALEKARAGKPG
jgi:hypothetical protein